MSKHTPGPWVARPDPNACQPDDWCVGIGDSLANIDKVAVCSERDAHLIAAAPDLLEALKSIVKSLADQDDEGLIEHAQQMIDARAAIAKATQRTV